MVKHTSKKNNQRSQSAKVQSRWTSVCTPELRTDLAPIRSDVKRILDSKDNMKHIQAQETYTTILHYQTPVSTDSSGNLVVVFSNDQSNSPDWVAFATKWDEYRCIGFRLKYKPVMPFGGSAVTFRAPVVIVTDLDDSTALSGYNAGSLYSDVAFHELYKEWSYMNCDSSLTDAGFRGIATTGGTFFAKIYSTGNTNSTTMGMFFVEYVVQFRQRGL